MPCIIVFSHLRWDFVYQRPQQILTRLAEHYRIIMIEEPIYDEGESHLEVYTPFPNLTVCRPHTSVQRGGFHDDQIAIVESLLEGIISVLKKPIIWFYTPMALPFLSQLDAGLMIYDCMDELSGFKNAPRQLLQREKALLRMADIVFTGGPSLHEAKRQMNPNMHCFPSSVDAVHFEQAVDSAHRHPLQENLRGPVLGFYGVLDERLDIELVAALADANSVWQIILVGPVVKIDPATLPRRSNIHYFGQQPYQALPQFLADWDVCLIPFALNEATRFISPTKVLEYMAAELPVVSTNIKDVADPYGDLVSIANSTEEFVAKCEAALSMSSHQRKALASNMRAVVASTSWEATVGEMFEIIETARSSTRASDRRAHDATGHLSARTRPDVGGCYPSYMQN